MSPENEIVPIGESVQKYDMDVFRAATKSGDFLPRLQLMTAASDKCKDGKFQINHYAMIRDQNFKDVGEAVDILVIAWRPKALEIGDEVISCFDPKNTEFVRIQEKSAEANSGCMYGPEFLVWVPAEKDFATFFCGSKSSRREAPSILAYLQKPATLKSRFVETKKFKWWTPAVFGCSTPFDTPNLDKLKAVVEKFNNPPATEVEVVEQGGGDRAR